METVHAGEAFGTSRSWDDPWLRRWAFPCVLAVGSVLLFVGLGARDLWSPDEPRYAAVAEELRSFAHGWRGLVLLHLNGEVYTQKPPLYFWLSALCGAPLDRVTEVAARLPSALGGLATLLLVGWLGRAMFRPASGVLAAIVLLTVPAWLGHARSARLDALLTAEVTLALVAAWRIERGIGSVRLARLALHAAIGLGVLTKGPVAALVPALGIASTLGWERRLAELRRYVTPASLLLSLAPGLAWLVASAALAPAGYLELSFWDNLVSRFLSGTAHVEPPGYYLSALPYHFLPWTLLWPLVPWRLRARWPALAPSERRAWRFLAATCAATLLFFSLSAGKRSAYLLPIYPLLAIACAETLAGWIGEAHLAPPWLRRAIAGSIATLALVGCAALVVHPWQAVPVPAAFGWLLVAGAAAAVGVARALRPRRGERAALVGAWLCALVACELAVHAVLYPALDVRESQRPVAELAAAASSPGEEIGVLGNDTAAAAVGYYAQRPVRELGEARDVADFLARGGRTVVADVRRLALTRAFPLREQARARAGRREFLVMTRPAQ